MREDGRGVLASDALAQTAGVMRVVVLVAVFFAFWRGLHWLEELYDFEASLDEWERERL